MVVKNLLVVGVIAGLASAASAAEQGTAAWKTGGLLRVDASQSTTSTKAGDASKVSEKESKIYLKKAQFKLMGDHGGHTLTFKANWEDGMGKLDTAMISHKFGDQLTMHAGKFAVLAQSWENSYDSSDRYLESWTLGLAPEDSVGVQLDYAIDASNLLSLQVMNGQKSNDTETFSDEGGLSTAIQYTGKFADGMAQPKITYTMVKPSGTKRNAPAKNAGESDADYATRVAAESQYSRGNGLSTQLGVGVKVATAGVDADLEYNMVTQNKLKALGSASSDGLKDTTNSSIIVHLAYAVTPETKPFLKVTMDGAKFGADEGAGDINAMGVALGAEHMLDKTCRLHAVYTMGNATVKKTAAGKDTKINDTGIVFGLTSTM